MTSVALLFVIHVWGIEVDTSQTRFDYDMGKTTSPVKSGWVAITPETSGDISWSETVSAADRGELTGVSDIIRDFIYSRNTITLNHKIANGDWVITLEMGDPGTGADAARDLMKVVAEGKTIGSNINTNPGEIKIVQGTVTVTDGELNITISDEGGSNPYWVWNRLSISEKPLPGTTGTLHHPNGEILRAAPLTFAKRYPGPVIWAEDINT